MFSDSKIARIQKFLRFEICLLRKTHTKTEETKKTGRTEPTENTGERTRKKKRMKKRSGACGINGPGL
jgi:hypothetical protein